MNEQQLETECPLIYADWLEERGRTIESELVRIRVALDLDKPRVVLHPLPYEYLGGGHWAIEENATLQDDGSLDLYNDIIHVGDRIDLELVGGKRHVYKYNLLIIKFITPDDEHQILVYCVRDKLSGKKHNKKRRASLKKREAELHKRLVGNLSVFNCFRRP